MAVLYTVSRVVVIIPRILCVKYSFESRREHGLNCKYSTEILFKRGPNRRYEVREIHIKLIHFVKQQVDQRCRRRQAIQPSFTHKVIHYTLAVLLSPNFDKIHLVDLYSKLSTGVRECIKR